jgi:hypothetical protein
MAAYILKDISFARYIGLFTKGVSERLPLLHVYRKPRNIMAERTSTGQAVGFNCAASSATIGSDQRIAKPDRPVRRRGSNYKTKGIVAAVGPQ